MTGRRRTAWLVAGALILGVLAIAVLAWRLSADDSSNANGATIPAPKSSSFVADVTAARPPYGGYSAGSLRVGDKTLAVVVADADAERIQGLRGRANAAPYDGMLFVWPEDTSAAFTMAGVPGPLDIAFYDAAGEKVGQLLMAPCPNGTDATCPIYQVDQPFRYALETAGGGLQTGSLRRP